MDVRHLDLLRELADRGSLAAVAQATHRTPSALSQQLRTAERAFGTALVEPHGRGLRLTEAGALLARGGTEVATAMARVEAAWEDYCGGPRGTVSVAALPSAATFLLPPLQQRLAGGPLELRCSDYDLAETDFAGLTADNDVVIGHSVTGERPAGTEGLTIIPLVVEPLDVALAADHPLAERPWLHCRDLVDQAWIGVPRGYPFDSVLVAVEQLTGTSLDVRQRLRDNRLVEALVASSSHVALLPRFTTRLGHGVVLRELRGVPARRHVVAIARPDRAERLAVRTVLEGLREAGAEVASPGRQGSAENG